MKWEWPQLPWAYLPWLCTQVGPVLIQLPSSPVLLLLVCVLPSSSMSSLQQGSFPSLPPLTPTPSTSYNRQPSSPSPQLQYKLLLSFALALSMGAQTAGVQARSTLILEMTLRHFYFSASLRHRHGQGLLHIALGLQSRQKENVKPCPRVLPHPHYSGLHKLTPT